MHLTRKQREPASRNAYLCASSKTAGSPRSTDSFRHRRRRRRTSRKQISQAMQASTRISTGCRRTEPRCCSWKRSQTSQLQQRERLPDIRGRGTETTLLMNPWAWFPHGEIARHYLNGRRSDEPIMLLMHPCTRIPGGMSRRGTLGRLCRRGCSRPWSDIGNIGSGSKRRRRKRRQQQLLKTASADAIAAELKTIRFSSQ